MDELTEIGESSALDAASAGDDAGYYVYGLVDPRVLRETGGNRLLSIFYVGKGVRKRWARHQSAELQALRDELLVEQTGSKAERIREILDRGHPIPAVRLSAGYIDSKDAERAESLAIDTINELLRAAKLRPLTNAKPGYKAGFIWLREHFTFTEVTELDIDPESASQAGPLRTELLVKGTTENLVRPGQRRATGDVLPDGVADVAARISAITPLWDEDPEAFTIRGWDAYDPWTDDEARERARRIWRIGAGRVRSWIRDPETMPAHLLLGIPYGGQTVVRYAWQIDPLGTWEYYTDSGYWGVPLGNRVHEHPRLGCVLYETRDGHRTQVLAGYSHGIREISA
jgi:hypothetical protein